VEKLEQPQGSLRNGLTHRFRTAATPHERNNFKGRSGSSSESLIRAATATMVPFSIVKGDAAPADDRRSSHGDIGPARGSDT
jgi:hypothetical protein